MAAYASSRPAATSLQTLLPMGSLVALLASAAPGEAATSVDDADRRRALEGAAWDALRMVWDPELRIDVVSLGLVYAVRTVDDRVCIDMTLRPGCRVLEQLPVEVAAAVARALPEHHVVDVRVVRDPPWTPERLSPEAASRVRFARERIAWPAFGGVGGRFRGDVERCAD